jgi:Zn finger protein HypA/HybF involved in hydrogenase expression
MPLVNINRKLECPFCGTTIYLDTSDSCPNCGEHPNDINAYHEHGIFDVELDPKTNKVVRV